MSGQTQDQSGPEPHREDGELDGCRDADQVSAPGVVRRGEACCYTDHRRQREAAQRILETHRPDHGSKDGYVRVREQARVQVAGRQGRPVHEVLDITEDHGLSLLPEPSEGDVFFDLEGDPFVGLTGREYLFGLVLPDGGEPKYEFRWALTATDENVTFGGVGFLRGS